MKLDSILDWLNATLSVADFDDVSNNGLQIARRGADVTRVAFAVDASVRAVRAARAAGAQLLVAHHGISWGGGIRRLTGGVHAVVAEALAGDLALYAAHLPLDAHPTLGNNAGLARALGLERTRPAFRYRGRLIGLVGESPRARTVRIGATDIALPRGLVGVCSGGAGDYAEEAKALGCALYVTGEASWGDVIAAQNAEIPLALAGHYETEVFGVRALAEAVRSEFELETLDLTENLK